MIGFSILRMDIGGVRKVARTLLDQAANGPGHDVVLLPEAGRHVAAVRRFASLTANTLSPLVTRAGTTRL